MWLVATPSSLPSDLQSDICQTVYSILHPELCFYHTRDTAMFSSDTNSWIPPFALRVKFKFLTILIGAIVVWLLLAFLALTTPSLHPYARRDMYQFFKGVMLYLALRSFTNSYFSLQNIHSFLLLFICLDNSIYRAAEFIHSRQRNIKIWLFFFFREWKKENYS